MCSLTGKLGGELRPFVFRVLLSIEYLADCIQTLLSNLILGKLVWVHMMGLVKANAEESNALGRLFFS